MDDGNRTVLPAPLHCARCAIPRFISSREIMVRLVGEKLKGRGHGGCESVNEVLSQ